MAVASCSAALVLPIKSFEPIRVPVKYVADSDKKKIGGIRGLSHKSSAARNSRVQNKAAASSDQNPKPKPKSVICGNCDGNGAVLCSQCKGSGVNSVDFFNGQFKAGDSCWLCGGKKDMLCGDCNGAGFMGGFMSTFDQ